MITVEMIEKAFKTVKEFESQNPGVAAGADFSEFAKVLLMSKGMDHKFESLAMIVLADVVSQKRSPFASAARDPVTDTITRIKIAELLYVFFTLGMEAAAEEHGIILNP